MNPLPLLMIFTIGLTVAIAAEPAAPTVAAVDAQIARAATWLEGQQQADGSFCQMEQAALGVTELVVLGLLESGRPADDPAVAKGIAYILQHVRDDGSIANPEAGNFNYTTAMGVMVLAKAGGHEAAIAKAEAWLRGIQNRTEGSITQGGAGYGSRGQGNEDLSNSSYWTEALRAAGVPADDPAMQEMLAFTERCQDLSSVNELAWAKEGESSGGGVYSPDSSKAAGSYHDGRSGEKPSDPSKPGQATELKPYGSMTYALIKNYLHLALTPDDPRVHAAVEWIRNNYTFDANPGMLAGKELQGLFYYYQTAAKALRLLGTTTIEVPGKGVRDWRADLLAAITERAQEAENGGGWWINAADRWHEGLPQLCTGYTLLALAHIKATL